MKKSKFSLTIGKAKQDVGSTRNIFDMEEETADSGKDTSTLNSNGLGTSYRSSHTIYEYNRSRDFYEKHPELLKEFEEKKEEKTEEVVSMDRNPEKRLLGESKYLGRIQEYVGLRNIERQEIQDEKIQKEIEQEKNTEVFITDSYRKVLEERKRFKENFTKKRLNEARNDSQTNGFFNVFEVRPSANNDDHSNLNDSEKSPQEEGNTGNDSSNLQTTSDFRGPYSQDETRKETNNDDSQDSGIRLSTEKQGERERQIETKIQQARERYFNRKLQNSR
ncbi:Coiled-coil domain-containing protein 55 (DUF2040) [Cryptosporidium felis]|nr:Coiled-coil domain-containing protein 55 (DUF2040) [Cryptosporidium felis]